MSEPISSDSIMSAPIPDPISDSPIPDPMSESIIPDPMSESIIPASSSESIFSNPNIYIYGGLAVLTIAVIYILYILYKQSNQDALITKGPATDTVLVPATSGLFSYSPAYWSGYAQSQIGGILKWNPDDARKGIELKVGDITQLILPYVGLYELTLSGSIYNGVSRGQTLSMFVNGVLYLANPCYYFNNDGNTGWQAISLSAFVKVDIPNTYVQYSMTSFLQTSTDARTILTAKFISL